MDNKQNYYQPKKKKKSTYIFIGIAILFVGSLVTSILRKDKQKTQSESIENTIENKAVTDSISKERLKKIESHIEKLNSSFRVSKDDFEGTTWFEQKNISQYADKTAFYTYISLNKDSFPILRLVIRYHGSDWLFIKKIKIKADDSNFELEPHGIKRDNDTEVWEWVDVVPDESQLRMLDVIELSNKVQIRFEGKLYHSDYSLNQKDLRSLVDTDRYYKLLKEKYEIKKSLNN